MLKRWLAVGIVLVATPLAGGDARTFDAVYTATISNLPRDVRELKVWIPIPGSRSHQSISSVDIESPYEWSRAVDREFGNEYIYTTIASPTIEALSVRIRFRATRAAQLIAAGPVLQPSAREMQRELRQDRLVTISPRIREIADEVTAARSTPLTKARAIYDYVLSTLIYDKTKPGWGNGDSERACDIKAGNCTDFHSLFISLARAKRIPARFIIGFSMPERGRGRAGGYHCWAEFYVDDLGWVGIDPSEASKSTNPIVRNFLFGNLDFDRVEFTRGRDIVLDPATAEPLNYFIYPYAEADGQPAGIGTIALDYRDVPAESSLTAVPSASSPVAIHNR